MPLFEYKCTNCQEHVDKIQNYKDPLLVKCPKCSKNTLIKIFSAPRFTLLGKGFYREGTF